MNDPNFDFLTKNDAAKTLARSPETVLYHESKGHLTSIRTAGGMRLFRRADVEKLARELQAKERAR